VGDAAAWVTSSAEETRALAEALGRAAQAGDVLLLEGPLGAGKTCFTQGLARGLGVTTPVRSPTFVLVTQHHGRLTLAHVDLYRVEGTGSLDDLGLDECRDGAVLAVEWGEKLDGRMDDALVVTLAEDGADRRRIEARARGARGRAWLEAWTQGAVAR